MLAQSLSFSQDIDSLISKSKEDISNVEKMKIYSQIAKYYKRKNFEKSLAYSLKSLKLAEEIGEKEEIAKILYQVGIAYYFSSRYDTAYLYMQRLNKLSIKNKYTFWQAKSLNVLALLEKEKANYIKSISYFKEGLKIAEDRGFIKVAVSIYSNLGVVFNELRAYKKAIMVTKKALRLNEKLGDSLKVAGNYNNLAVYYRIMREYENALKACDNAYKLSKKLNSDFYISKTYNTRGTILLQLNEIEESIKYFQKALELKLKLGNKHEMAITYENLSMAYIQKENYDKTIEYLQKARVLYEQEEGFYARLDVLNIIAKAYNSNKDYKLAKKCIDELDSLLKNINFLQHRVSLYENYYLYYKGIKNYKKALLYHEKFKILEDSISSNDINDKIAKQMVLFEVEEKEHTIDLLSKSEHLKDIEYEKQKSEIKLRNLYLYSIAAFGIVLIIAIIFIVKQLSLKQKANKYLKYSNSVINNKNNEIENQQKKLISINSDLRKLTIAMQKTKNAVVIMNEKGEFEWVNEGFINLYEVSFEDFKRKHGNIFKASLNSNDPNMILRILKNSFENKVPGEYEFSTKIKNGEKIWVRTTITPIVDENNKLISVIAIDIDITKRKNYESRIKNQTEEITTQRDLLSNKNFNLEKQKEEMDSSLRYAKTIQQAILPVFDKKIIKYQYFLIYRPKEIVSGDFYWFAQPKDTQYTFYSVVDCTGHGVPGAFMSMIGTRLLNKIINENEEYIPNVILEEMHLSVKETLKQDVTGNRDGMDISLCRIEDLPNGKFEIIFSGAKQAIFYYKNRLKELIKIRGDVKTIGGLYYEEVSFTNEKFILEKGDTLYLISDGIIDQNSIKRKKMGTSQFSQILFENATKNMDEQKAIITEKLETHMRGVLQRDDITILGIRL